MISRVGLSSPYRVRGVAVVQAVQLGSAMSNCAELQQHLVSIMAFKDIANLVFGTSSEDPQQ